MAERLYIKRGGYPISRQARREFWDRARKHDPAHGFIPELMPSSTITGDPLGPFYRSDRLTKAAQVNADYLGQEWVRSGNLNYVLSGDPAHPTVLKVVYADTMSGKLTVKEVDPDSDEYSNVGVISQETRSRMLDKDSLVELVETFFDGKVMLPKEHLEGLTLVHIEGRHYSVQKMPGIGRAAIVHRLGRSSRGSFKVEPVSKMSRLYQQILASESKELDSEAVDRLYEEFSTKII
ncbi:MAG: hypothetical protein KJ709_04455 [Nanoarchaeota archaeon]|nr:hypothetical protein [Nanoarchaeota archaeon]